MANTTHARYVAITCTEKWYVLEIGAEGESAEELERRMRERISGNMNPVNFDIYHKTRLGNLRVMSLSAARRAFPGELRQYQEWEAYEAGRSSRYPTSRRPASLS